MDIFVIYNTLRCLLLSNSTKINYFSFWWDRIGGIQTSSILIKWYQDWWWQRILKLNCMIKLVFFWISIQICKILWSFRVLTRSDTPLNLLFNYINWYLLITCLPTLQFLLSFSLLPIQAELNVISVCRLLDQIVLLRWTVTTSPIINFMILI